MIVSFNDRASQDIFNGVARKACPQALWPIARRKLDFLDAVIEIEELRIPPGNRLEPLSAHRQGQHSIRMNEQYRLCFKWGPSGPFDVEVTDYH